MDAARLGRVLRAVRLHLGLTQREVAGRAGVSQSVYSEVERGESARLKLGTVDRIATSLGASLSVEVRYQGGLADRLVDRAHAALVEVVVGVLRHAGWQVEVEYSFNVFGERGSVDVLAWHATTRTLLIIEVKSRFTDLQALLLSFGRKLRLVPEVARRELGWDALAVGRVVVASGSAGNRAIVARHPSIFMTSLPARAHEIRRWVRDPAGPIAGVWFVSNDVVPTRATAVRRRR
jgi:DNA-binding XRE family transcriptional regulator